MILIVSYLLVLLALTISAGGIALFVTDNSRANRAARILAALLTAIMGCGGILALLIRLHGG